MINFMTTVFYFIDIPIELIISAPTRVGLVRMIIIDKMKKNMALYKELSYRCQTEIKGWQFTLC